MSIRILAGDVHLIDLQTRLPFKYGIATMTAAPQVFVRLLVEINSRPVPGVAADVLPPKWFKKNPDQPLDAEILEMLEVVEHAVNNSLGVNGPTVFDAWRAVYDQQSRWGQSQNHPSLLSQFGTTLVERALIEAFCRALNKPFFQALRDNDFGIRLETIHSSLTDCEPGELLPPSPLRRITARHTVGYADPLENADIEEPARLDDGLPQSLTDCIQHYGLKHFKLKLSGCAEPDAARLERIAAVLEREAPPDFLFTLDGNESFRTLDTFRTYWEALAGIPRLTTFLRHLLFVEQPFHRDMALDAQQLANLKLWSARPRLIIDESDAELDSLPRALALGYHGTSHKNCKGVFKGVANACLLQALTPRANHFIMSGEDLANIGPVALLQDLAVVASLGVSSVERNGHHYFAGLSAFPSAVQNAMLERHGDLYHRSPRGWPTLHISGGELALDSVVDAPLGVGFEIDVTPFTPAEHWNKSKPSFHPSP